MSTGLSNGGGNTRTKVDKGSPSANVLLMMFGVGGFFLGAYTVWLVWKLYLTDLIGEEGYKESMGLVLLSSILVARMPDKIQEQSFEYRVARLVAYYMACVVIITFTLLFYALLFR